MGIIVLELGNFDQSPINEFIGALELGNLQN
jgi:hypothetical protein